MKTFDDYLKGDGNDVIDIKRGLLRCMSENINTLAEKIEEQNKKIDFIMKYGSIGCINHSGAIKEFYDGRDRTGET